MSVPAPVPKSFERGVLVLVCALVVARPLVAGEDPGLLEPSSGVGGLVLNALWLLAGLAWAAGSLWTGRSPWRFGWVEAALLGFASLLFVAADFTRPSLLAAWDALVLVIVFSLVRQLAADSRAWRGLVAAVVTTGSCVAVFAVYQQVVELPRLHAIGAQPDVVRSTLLEQYGLNLADDSPRLLAWAERWRTTPVFSTFESPSTLACYLALVVPVLVAVAIATWKHSGRRWLLGPLAVLVVVGGAALWLSFPSGQTGRAEAWAAATGLVSANPWLGTGGANFSRSFPPSSVFIAWQANRGPQNALLEAVTAGGVAAGVLLVLAVAIWFRRAWATRVEDRSPDSSVPWECYVGGMLGLLLAFSLRALRLPAAEILGEGIGALVRAAVWFAAFGLSYAVLRPGKLIQTGLVVGVAACLLMLMFNDGLTYASLAQSAAVVAALAVPAAVVALPSAGPGRLARLVLPVVLFLVGGVVYLMVVYPSLASARALDAVRVARPKFREAMGRDRVTLSPATLHLLQEINGSLADAAAADPTNPVPLLRKADWSRELGLQVDSPDYAPKAVEPLRQARALDPLRVSLGVETLTAEFEVHVQYAGLCARLRDRLAADAKKKSEEAKALQDQEAKKKKSEEAKALQDKAEAMQKEVERHLKEAEANLQEAVLLDAAEEAWLRARLTRAQSDVKPEKK